MMYQTLAALFLTCAAAQTVCNGTSYTVKPNETATSIVTALGLKPDQTTADLLFQLNPELQSLAQIVPGFLLCLPSSASKTCAGTTQAIPEAAAGSLNKVLAAFDLPLNQSAVIAFANANPSLKSESSLTTGLQVCVPNVSSIASATACASRVPIPGEAAQNLTAVLAALGLPATDAAVTALANLNPNVKSATDLRVGLELCVPVVARVDVEVAQTIAPPVNCTGSVVPIPVAAAGNLSLTLSGLGLPLTVASIEAFAIANPNLLFEANLTAGLQVCVPPVSSIPFDGNCTGKVVSLPTAGAGNLTFALQAVGLPVTESAANDFLVANPDIQFESDLLEGLQVCVPSSPANASCAGPVFTVSAAQVGNLSAVIAAINLPYTQESVDALQAVNPQLTVESQLTVGLQLCAPVSPPPGPQNASCAGQKLPIPLAAAGNLTLLLSAFGLPVTNESAAVFANANPQLTAEAQLIAGSLVCVPTAAFQVAPGPGQCTGAIRLAQVGESVQSILLSLGLPFDQSTVAAIQQANPQIPNLNSLTAGVQICIPPAVSPSNPLVASPSPSPANPFLPQGSCAGTLHTVAAGESFAGIIAAARLPPNQDTANKVLALNPGIASLTKVTIGQLICLPPINPTYMSTPYMIERFGALNFEQS